jgi:uncharacterized protein YbaP (TraB family)
MSGLFARASAVIALTMFSMASLALVSPTMTSAQAKCGGSNILPRLTKSHPEIMSQVRARAAEIRNTEAIFWRIEKLGVKSSYLLGTMHVSDARITAMPEPAQKALDLAKMVVLEIEKMSPAAMMKAAATAPQLMVYVDGSRLDQRLTKAEFEQVSALLGKTGLPARMNKVLRPWMISIMLAVPECERQRAAAGQLALDQWIGNTARKQGTPVVGLETVEEQLKSMAGVPEKDQLAMLRVSLAFIKQRQDLFETLIQAYTKRDLGVILALSDGMAKIAGMKNSGFASFSRELITKRNRKMFKRSLPIVDKGGAFIAVGAAHLIDETGLVALYRKAGFTVSAVN